MTDTGQIPGEGQPENAGMVEQPGVLAPDAYTYLDPSEQAPDEEDLLLMPAVQGTWSDPQVVPPPAADAYGQFPSPSAAPVHEYPVQESPSAAPDSGAFDLAGVRIPAPAAAPVAAHAAASAAPSRRPLHRGPSVDGPSYGGQSSLVRSLADRGPAGSPQPHAPVRPPVRTAPPAPAPVAPEPSAYAEAPVVPETPVAPEPSAYAETPAYTAAPVAPGPAEAPAYAETSAYAEAPAYAESPAASEYPAPAELPVAPEYAEVPLAPEPVLPGPQPGEIPLQGAAPWGAPEPAAAEEPSGTAGTVTAEALPSEAVPSEAVPSEALPGETVPGETAPAGTVPDGPDPTPAEALQQPAPDFATPDAGSAPEHLRAEAPAGLPAETVVLDAAAEAEAPAPLPAQASVFMPGAAPEPYVPVQGSVPDTAPFPAGPDGLAEAPAVVPAPAATVREPHVPAEQYAVAEPPATEPPAAGPLTAEPVPVEAVVAEPAFEPVAPDAVPVALPEPDARVTDVPETGAQQADRAPEAVDHLAEGSAPAPGHEDTAAGPADSVATASIPAVLPASIPAVAEAEAVAEPVAETVGDPFGETAPEASAPGTTLPEPGRTDAPEEPVSDPAPGYDEAEREAVLRVMRERRDIRNGFRSDPIPHEVLLRVLEAAHHAPSVGHSQPWDFVVIRSAETRRSMHELAQRQRDAYAKSLPKGRAKQFREMKIEAILDTPVNIVVTADPTRGGRHTLGRHTQPQMAPYSSALAVENLWLAARAEGLGVGWVSFFDEREMVRALGLPEHLEIVAYLCVGYVDEFPDEPELMQAGWSKRRPLSWVVHEETYGRRALPGEEPHDLLQETIATIRPLDAKALGEAWERQKRMTTPAGALGMLEIISAQLSGLSRMCPPPIPEPAAVAIFAGDHGVHAQGVTAWPQEVTGQMVANFLAGGAVCNAFASQVGAEVCVVDVGVAQELPATPGLLPRKVRPGTADFTTGPAMSREDVLAAIEVGIETARDLVAAGNKGLLIGEMGIANTTASAALICVYTGADPSEVTGRGTGINDEMHARKIDVVRRALELHQPDPADPIGVLAAVGGLEHAAMAGYLLGGASLRTPVILDGVSAGAAALVARAIAPEALAACIAGHRSAEPGHVAALNKLGLRPLIDLDLRLGEGTGALLALPIVQSAARAMHEVATFDSAGVTEK
ncbi:nicotinate-nucleotide--dimethylbenzimidazole phosphoribosyltransferase [Streptomyces sp. NBC_01218]|uniref:nicotinate-nucleotide--dimethylbenzimidazole phosphoribosyltransferase n=1 Tax=Streptomyces sp. NBC_01218 TaxID=2903780 RepID=UPI002E0F5D7F|nr:nicotinate-nucleotide--dimethylbenzimidazole phosphoribosyltransferase [Streptomyces sp. NBC_01218]